jgi:hypothetical protein
MSFLGKKSDLTILKVTSHFQQDFPERRLNCPPTLRVDRAAVTIDDDSDVICVYG